MTNSTDSPTGMVIDRSTASTSGLEAHFSLWEFRAEHHVTASDAESMSMRDLLSYATVEQRDEFENMWLGYTETWGAPDLRNAIAATFRARTASDVLGFAGASEGIFAANSVLLDGSSHAVVVTPNYQSHETLPVAICEATGVPLDPDDDWSLDIDRVAAAIRPNTKLVTIRSHEQVRAVIEHVGRGARLDIATFFNFDVDYGFAGGTEPKKLDPYNTWSYDLASWASFFQYVPPQPLADNTKPVLYAAGEKDPNITPDVVKMVADGIGGPVTVEIFPDGVHQLMLFETEAFSTLVHDFCTGVIAGG